MATKIIEISRRFFEKEIKPVLESEFPVASQQVACGIFGYGSECLGMDDQYSRDHHWGLRIDVLIPDEHFKTLSQEIRSRISAKLPESFEGYDLREGHVEGAGIAPESLEGFLSRTIGLTRAPRSLREWLDMPEEDIVHVTNGEVWYDPSSRFSNIRKSLTYYPEPVWLRRISHWCRYLSGMGIYPLHRALLRDNLVYATTAFGRSIKWMLELAFMLNKTYFPYDKWLYPFFRDLPDLAGEMDPLVADAIASGTTWERRLEILNDLSDILDQKMVALGIIPRHPRFKGSETSGYRLLEHAYGAIVKSLPAEIKNHVPRWDQTYLEEFHTASVDTLPMDTWNSLLNLTPVEESD